MKKEKWLFGLAAGASVAGLVYALWPKSKIPAGAIVEPFDKEKYLGTWHEIARLPNKIEQNLRDLTNEYSLNPNGTINVITRAYNIEKNKPVEASGTIKFKGPETRGKMEVAYYLPIYLDYNVLDIDEDYQHALVSGNNLDYLWIISRETNLPPEIGQRFLEKATLLGFNVGQLEWM